MEAELVAHRGYTLHYPENTLPGIDAAAAAGARYVEVDVQLSLDEVPVLFHDDTLKRVCGVDGRVGDLGYLHLCGLAAHEFDRFGYRYMHVRIARLDELCAWLTAHPGITAFIEIKGSTIAQFGEGAVLRRVLAEIAVCPAQCVLISFSQPFLAKARTHGPVGAVIERWSERRQALRALAPEYLFCDVNGLPRWGAVRVRHTRVAVYEVADPWVARRLFARGVDLIETFAVGEMRAGLGLS